MEGLPNKVLSIVLIVLIIAVGAVILDNFSTNIASTNTDSGTLCNATVCLISTAWNVTQSGLGGMQTFGNWINIIVIMVVVGAIIGLIYGVFRFVGGGDRQTAY